MQEMDGWLKGKIQHLSHLQFISNPRRDFVAQLSGQRVASVKERSRVFIKVKAHSRVHVVALLVELLQRLLVLNLLGPGQAVEQVEVHGVGWVVERHAPVS